MAIQPRNLFRGPFTYDNHKNVQADLVQQEVFAKDAAITATDSLVEDVSSPGRGDTWPFLTAVYFDDVSGTWKVWTAGHAIEGFMFGASGVNSHSGPYGNRTGRLQLSKTHEVMGLVLKKGIVNFPELPLPPGEDIEVFKAALKSGLREDGITVMGLLGVH